MRFRSVSISFMASLLISPFSYGAYTGNVSGKVAWVKIYNSEIIYFQLDVMPTDHQCLTNYFVLMPSATEKQKDRYYSMLLSAKSAGASVTVGYDKINPDCYADRPVVHSLIY